MQGGLLDLADRAHEGRAGGGVHLGHGCDLRGWDGRGVVSDEDGQAGGKKSAVSAIRRLDGKRGGGAGSIEHARRAPPTPPHTTERAAAASIVPRPDASPIALRAGFRSGGTAGLDEPRTDRAARPRPGSPRRDARGAGGLYARTCGVRKGISGSFAHLWAAARTDGRRRSRNDLASVASKRRWPAAGNFQMSPNPNERL